MMRFLYIFILTLSIGCKTQYGYDSIGLFSPNKRVEGQQYFMTLPGNSNLKMKKLTEDELSYYVWKTVKYNYVVDEEESFSSFKTLKNEDLEEMSPEDVAYVQNSANLLNNYLFFLDDYRCIYLSEDDNRDDESFGKIPLFFDDKYYKIDKDIYGSKLDQIIRGYYKLDGNQLFIDFGGITHFYVTATVDETSIHFKEIHIPESGLVKANGINNTYVAFDKFLNDEALPIFEVPQDDVIREPRFTLVSGLKSKTKKKDRKNPLETVLMQIDQKWSNRQVERLVNITYDLESDPPKRFYEIEIMTTPPRYDTIRLEERLDQIATW